MWSQNWGRVLESVRRCKRHCFIRHLKILPLHKEKGSNDPRRIIDVSSWQQNSHGHGLGSLMGWVELGQTKISPMFNAGVRSVTVAFGADYVKVVEDTPVLTAAEM